MRSRADSRPINVLIVDDSVFLAELLQDIIASDPQMRVVGIARNGKEAVEKAGICRPDIITMDISMDVLNGIEATREIMARNPIPILIVTNSIARANSEEIFSALSAGALDVFDKSLIEFKDNQMGRDQLLRRLKYLSGVPVAPRVSRKETDEREKFSWQGQKASNKIVVIVASTGGPQAICSILKKFDTHFPCGILIVQHISRGFEENFTQWLDYECAIEVKIPEHNELIRPGVAYIAPHDKHLRVNTSRGIDLGSEPPVGGFRPSGNILLKSVAAVYGKNAIGVILSGMGKDGADGMMAVKEKKGLTIAQDEETSLIFGMPKVAIEMGAVNHVLPLGKIPEAILASLKK